VDLSLGVPWMATPEFNAKIQGATGRRLVPQKGGRPHKPAIETGQGEFLF